MLEATRRAIDALAADEVDLAIVTQPPREEGWAVVELAESQLVALVGPRHPLASGPRGRRSNIR